VRTLSNNLLFELYSQESTDPLLMLVSLYHSSFGYIYLVHNIENVVSQGHTFNSFPMRITLPADDGEKTREATIEFDNTDLSLIDELRSVRGPIECRIQMVLASHPDIVEIELGELKLRDITYNKNVVSARLSMDDFLNSAVSDERYTPNSYPGLY
jgi:hypothetical protein